MIAKSSAAVGSAWLFPSPKNPAEHACSGYVSAQMFQIEARTAGFPHAYFHGLLHIFTTRLHDSGLEDVEGKALAAASLARAHDGTGVTQRYIHTSDEARWPLMRRMDAWIEERMNPDNLTKSRPKEETEISGDGYEPLN